jgi:hypothetical protein
MILEPGLWLWTLKRPAFSSRQEGEQHTFRVHASSYNGTNGPPEQCNNQRAHLYACRLSQR